MTSRLKSRCRAGLWNMHPNCHHREANALPGSHKECIAA
jgi:hypothetical protein